MNQNFWCDPTRAVRKFVAKAQWRRVAQAARLPQHATRCRLLSTSHVPTAQPSRLITVLKRSAAVTVLGSGGALGYAYLYDEGLWRTLRVLNSLIPMGVDYWHLYYRVSSSPEDVRRRAFDAYHERWRDAPLRVCLDLRGFYVKVGQLCAGFPGDGLPTPYKESLKVLQENVPPQPFDRIRQIVEMELAQPLEAIFAEFEPHPIGAASIGQVHRARLRDGSDVVVKVQYPEVEANFRRDFTTIKSIFLLVNKVLLPVLDAVEEGFAAEFDYRLEAANLRRMVDDVLPLCQQAGLRIDFPAPYDERHPNLPAALRQRGRSLATKRVMVMEQCVGSSLSKVGRRLLVDYAATQGCAGATPRHRLVRSFRPARPWPRSPPAPPMAPPKAPPMAPPMAPSAR